MAPFLLTEYVLSIANYVRGIVDSPQRIDRNRIRLLLVHFPLGLILRVQPLRLLHFFIYFHINIPYDLKLVNVLVGMWHGQWHR